jgi:hypothetical protein
MVVDFRFDDDVLVATFTGHVLPQELYETRDQSLRLMLEGGIHKFLVDLRSATIECSLLDIYQFTSSLAEIIPPRILHAIVYSPATHNTDRAFFGESLASNRGVPLKMFTRLDDAHYWLSDQVPLQGPSSRSPA